MNRGLRVSRCRSNKGADSRVFAGSITQSGVREVRTERVGRDASHCKIVEAAEHAGLVRAGTETGRTNSLPRCLPLRLEPPLSPTSHLATFFQHCPSFIIVAGARVKAAVTSLPILGAVCRYARLGSPAVFGGA